mgnify:CR=1 FL=1
MTRLWLFLFLVGLMLSAATQAASEGLALKGDPIPVEATITIDLASEEPAIAARQAAGLPVTHLRSVPGVVEGQRIPLPRAADGTCNLDVVVTVQGPTGSPPAEFSADGARFTQHIISQQVGTKADEATCELVVWTAQARDHVKTKRVKRISPRIQRALDALPTNPALGPQSSGREFENPRVLYQYYSRSRSGLYYDYGSIYGYLILKMYSWMDMHYYDQPSRGILGFTRTPRDGSGAANGYWISNQSYVQLFRPWEGPYYALGAINNILGAGTGWSGALRAVIYAYPYNTHGEWCAATRPYASNKLTLCDTKHYLEAAYLQ